MWAKIQLREQSIHLVSVLLSSCGAGEGQSGAEGISKPLCHLDLSVTLVPFSKVFLSTSPYLGYLSDLAIISLLPFPLFLYLILALGIPILLAFSALFSLCVCLRFNTVSIQVTVPLSCGTVQMQSPDNSICPMQPAFLQSFDYTAHMN